MADDDRSPPLALEGSHQVAVLSPSSANLPESQRRGRSCEPVIIFPRLPVSFVDLCRLVGNGGDSPNGSGGMIPSTAPPFTMTRWVAQARVNYDQPAIWMGEGGQVTVTPGAGNVRSEFEDRRMGFSHEGKVVSPSYCGVELEAIEGGKVFAELIWSVHLEA